MDFHDKPSVYNSVKIPLNYVPILNVVKDVGSSVKLEWKLSIAKSMVVSTTSKIFNDSYPKAVNLKH